jgi:hypothetical protein
LGQFLVIVNLHEVIDDNNNHYKSMIMDAMKMNCGDVGECSIIDEEPNTDATRFCDLLKDSDKSLWDGFTNYSKLLTGA